MSVITDYIVDYVEGAILKSKDVDVNMHVYFDVIQEHSISLQSQITDNYLENNTAIADHIANSPITVSLRGVSGEVVYEPSITEESINGLAKGGVLTNLYNYTNTKLGDVSLGSKKLTDITILLPPIDNITQIAKNTISYVEASYNRYSKIIKGFLNPTEKQSRLKQIYHDLCTLRENKTALIVYTPYETIDNLYIQSLTLRQGNEKYTTDIELSLKQVYFSEIQTTEADKSVLDKYNQFQRASVENHGKASGVNTEDSILYTKYGNGAAYTNKG